MNDKRTREKYKDLDGIKKAVSELLGQAWTRGYKCGALDNKIDPSCINLDEVKDWNICGYRVEDLYKLALILKDKRIEDYDLRDYNACFFEGYAKAQEDFNKSLDEMVNKTIGGDNNIVKYIAAKDKEN